MKVVRILLLALCANFALDGCTGCSKNPNIQNKLKAEGDACAKDDECESGVCDAVGDDAKTCLRTCNEGCDPTDVCTPLADADRYVCLPEKPGLCQTCQLDEDCPYPADRCLIIGGTKMCGRDCSNPQDGVQQCPSSYRCADATDANGGLVTKQCQPISGTCECTSASVGQTKPCSESNSYGTCMGQQTCQPPNGYTSCSAPVPAAESCNGKDDDCNGQVDEGLGETSCGIGACRRTSSNCINGQPATCMPGAPTIELCDGIDSNCDGIVDTDIAQPEICDGLDNDCDGLIDEDFNLASDVSNCGQCGNACGINNGNIDAYACIASTCGIGQCTTGFADCDQSYATGCETDVANGITINGVLTNCGACNQVCTIVHGTATCVAGECNVGVCDDDGVHHWQDCYPDSVDGGAGCETDTNVTVSDCATCGHACANRPNSTPVCSGAACSYSCLPTYFDVDGLANNGCEYQCTVTNGGVDDPDDLWIDQNCDGIDGDLSKAIFVSLSGNDLNDGLTRTTPKRTIQAGINAANSTRAHVYVAAGTYNEAVSLRSGISVWGGFNPATWKRNDASGLFTTITNSAASSNRIITITGNGISAPTTLGYLTVTTGAGGISTGDGVSTYAVHCTGCTALTLSSMNLISGAAGAGAAASAGSGGAGPTGSMTGVKGFAGSNDGESGGAGGNGGYACGGSVLTEPGSGGRGGDGRNGGTAGNTGSYGYNASGVPATPAGAGGAGSGSDTCNPGQGQTGFNGGAGSSGAAGLAGAGFSVAGGFVVVGTGTSGGVGGVGNGGGGGGGGGGQGDGSIWDGCDDGRGNGGGGGGGGGCPGSGGSGGRGGGGSFALFLVNSSNVEIKNSRLTSGQGGRGGDGGSGGAGANGGNPGAGGNGANETGLGGPGGYGGRGGHGGGGGGGAGGPSYAVFRAASTVTLDTFSASNLVTGGGGSGGSGGSAQAGGNAGQTGAVGPSAGIY